MRFKELYPLVGARDRNKFTSKLDEVINVIDDGTISEIQNIIEKYVTALHDEDIRKELIKRITIDLNNDYQLDIAVDFLVQDGKCIVSYGQLFTLYNERINEVYDSMLRYRKAINDNEDDNILKVDEDRLRDYRIYANCVNTAYTNNREELNEEKFSQNISPEENSVLKCLASELGLSHAEARGLYLSKRPDFNRKFKTDTIIEKILKAGLGIYSKSVLYIPEEIVEILRDIRGISIGSKYLRKILASLPPRTISRIIRRHQIEYSSEDEKIKRILDSGVDAKEILRQDLYADCTDKNKNKAEFKEFVTGKLGFGEEACLGRTLDKKVDNFIKYILEYESKKRESISIDGFECLLIKIGKELKTKAFIGLGLDPEEFNDKTAEELVQYDISPEDLLYVLSDDELRNICALIGTKGLKTADKMDLVSRIIDKVNEEECELIKHYIELSNNDSVSLSEIWNNIAGGNYGTMFQKATQIIFEKLNLNVVKISNPRGRKAYPDIILDSKKGLIIVECKSSRKGEYTSFNDVTEQLNAYVSDYGSAYSIAGGIIVSCDFSQDFIARAGDFDKFSLSLLRAQDLKLVYDSLNNICEKQENESSDSKHIKKLYDIQYWTLTGRPVVNPELVISAAKEAVKEDK